MSYCTNEPVRTIELPTGVLTVTVDQSDLPLEDLCGFAARRNPKRGFLFVSKVLGKHIPVRPSLMLDVHDMVAAKIPADLPGPVVVIGMAETAICLGHGVFESYKRMTSRDDVVFLHSTRYLVDRPIAIQFLEEHSHAADHIMYMPESLHACALFENARSLVLVDDEASTGKTFVNLANAFKDRIPCIAEIVTAVITDWRGPKRTAVTHAAMPVPVRTVALLQGEYQFSAADHLRHIEMPHVAGNFGSKDHLLWANHGRFGLTGDFDLPLSVVQRLEAIARQSVQSCLPLLVLGTGEFSFPPFLVALALERMGANVSYQTTTRSPVMTGGAIDCSLTFRDNYEDGIPNFLYNVTPGHYGQVVIVHETPSGSVCTDLVSALNAVEFEM